MRPRHLLTDRTVRSARPQAKPYRIADGGNLHLLVKPGGGKYFVLRYALAGAENMLSLGSYPDTSLADARDKAEVVRRQLQNRQNPAVERERERTQARLAEGVTFERTAREWIAHLRAEGRAESYVRKIECSLNASAIRALGTLPINEIDARMVRELVLAPIVARGALDQASNVRLWISHVLDFAISAGTRVAANPCRAISKSMPTHVSTHYAALTAAEVPTFLKRLSEYAGTRSTAIAIELLMRLGLRQGELRKLEWDWIDLRAKTIAIPSTVMKKRRVHIVPLSRQAIALLEEQRGYVAWSPYVFPGTGAKHPVISENTINKSLRLLHPERHVVAHGMRALFRTTAEEHGGFRPEVLKAALAHLVGNKTEQAYNRQTYLAERARLMQWWSDTLDAWRTGPHGRVIAMPARRRAR